jgi:NADPH-dependent 2,4-dienoyl-CoA reductase/sulfur reductase-like enzyme
MNIKQKPHVVVIGAGFAGLETARGLANAPVRITLIDKNNHHLPGYYLRRSPNRCAPSFANKGISRFKWAK